MSWSVSGKKKNFFKNGRLFCSANLPFGRFSTLFEIDSFHFDIFSALVNHVELFHRRKIVCAFALSTFYAKHEEASFLMHEY